MKYDTRCHFNMRSQDDTSQLYLSHRNIVVVTSLDARMALDAMGGELLRAYYEGGMQRVVWILMLSVMYSQLTFKASCQIYNI